MVQQKLRKYAAAERSSEMLEQLSQADQRRALLASRLHFSPEFTTPRKNAAEAILENALYLTETGDFVSASQILETLAKVAGVSILRCQEVEDLLKELAASGRVLKEWDGHTSTFKLAPKTTEEISDQYEEAARKLDRVVSKLYRGVSPSTPRGQLKVLLTDALCEIFSAFGSQWASYVTGTPIRDILNSDKLDRIIGAILKRRSFPPGSHPELKRATTRFFRNSDPDFDQIKFGFGQNMYVIQLLGMDGCDLLSQDAFRNAQLYLDSSVVIPALLEGSRHHRVFHELLAICSQLDIQVFVSRPTADEVRNVAAIQEKLAPEVYDLVPDGLAKQVKGVFFGAYRSAKALKPGLTFDEFFEPFQNLSGYLDLLNIKVVDDERFESFKSSSEIELVIDTLQRSSEEHRKRPKFKNALIHDAVMFRYLRSITEEKNAEKIWFVTMDISLPYAWSKFQTDRVDYRCFLLDGLLQAIAPFVSGTVGTEVSELFGQVVATQILPQMRLFEVDDFMVFRDLEIDCNEMDEETVQEALSSIKRHVLKGATYSRANLEEAAYELRRVFARRKQSAAAWVHERDNLEARVDRLSQEITDVEQANRLQIDGNARQYEAQLKDLQDKLDLEEQSQLTQAAVHECETLRMKRLGAFIFGCFALCVTTLLGLRFGAGTTLITKLVDFKEWYAAAFFVWLFGVKLLFFRKQSLKVAFPNLSEVLEMFK
jgi:predicted nucleic acid-binding protein